MSKEKFTLFWKGPFSQWAHSPFTVSGVEFSHAEQFMMYCKALLFQGEQCAQEILQFPTPRQQKAIARRVEGFNPTTWEIFRERVVYPGNYAKFTQNAELVELLLATSGTTLVEASPHDRIWGIGLGENDPRAQNRSQWRGLNLLGETLTRVREAIEWEMNRTGKSKMDGA